MAENPITPPLPADLPENWQYGQIVAPAGADVGLSEQHGYNYLMAQVNAAQQGVNTLGQALEQVPALGDDGRIAAAVLPEGSLRVETSGGVGTLPVSDTWRSVAYGGGRFVAIVFGGSIAAVSEDGVTWTQTALPASANWHGVAYGGGRFVTLAYGGDIAAYSMDGITWTQTPLPTTAYWRSVAYGGGRFVAVSGDNSDIAATSTNGITWTQTTMPASSRWNSVAYGGGRFVAVSGDNSGIAATSTDGITWTQTTMPASSRWNSVTYGNGKFVATASGVNSAYSEDGITWTQATMLSESGSWDSVAYGGGRFVAVSMAPNKAAYSEDGITWTQTTMPDPGKWFTIAYGGDRFVALDGGLSDAAAYSIDGIHWMPLVVDGYEKDVTDDIAAALQISRTVSATLTASGWTGSGPWTQTVTVAGLTSSSNGIVGPSTSITDAQFTAMQAAALRPSAQAENSLTIKATGTKPTVSLPIQVVIVR